MAQRRPHPAAGNETPLERAHSHRVTAFGRIAAIACLFVLAALLPACRTARLDTAEIRPRAELRASLPLPGTLLVRIAPQAGDQRSHQQFARNDGTTSHVGRELRDAALAVAGHYFREVASLTPEARAHFVLSVDASAAEPGSIANNDVFLAATLYTNDGAVVHRAIARAATAQFGDRGRAAYFNAYVDALRTFLDEVVLAHRAAIERVLASRSPGSIAFAYAEGSAPDRVRMVGTGARVSPTGIVVTARHVAQDCLGVAIVQGATLEPLRVLAGDAASGVLVLVSASPDPGPSLLIGHDDTPLPVGAAVSVLNFDRAQTSDGAVRWIAGTVRAPSRVEDDPRRILLDIPLPAGSRGGPVFDANGRFVGITLNSSDIAADAGPTAKPTARLHAAFPIADVRRLLDGYDLGDGSAAARAPGTAATNEAAVVRIACVE